MMKLVVPFMMPEKTSPSMRRASMEAIQGMGRLVASMSRLGTQTGTCRKSLKCCDDGLVETTDFRYRASTMKLSGLKATHALTTSFTAL